jgi:hypothetical protein
VAEQPTHLHAVSFVPANYFLLHFEMLYIGSGFFTSFVLTRMGNRNGNGNGGGFTFSFKNNWN